MRRGNHQLLDGAFSATSPSPPDRSPLSDHVYEMTFRTRRESRDSRRGLGVLRAARGLDS